jgi:hypothetical protein
MVLRGVRGIEALCSATVYPGSWRWRQTLRTSDLDGQISAGQASQCDRPKPIRVQVQIFVEERLVGHDVTQKPTGGR